MNAICLIRRYVCTGMQKDDDGDALLGPKWVSDDPYGEDARLICYVPPGVGAEVRAQA